MIATMMGAVPISSAAWLTLVRVMPAFCSRTVPPYPTAPEASSAGLNADAHPGADHRQQDDRGHAKAHHGEPARRQPLQG